MPISVYPDKVHIAVFGPGYGESIIFYVPEVGWGIIDCCKYKIKEKWCNPPLDFLKENQIKKLAFVILTHPHEDHFSGLAEVMDFFMGSIDTVAYYSGSGLREYINYLAASEALGDPKGLQKFGNVMKKFKEAEKKGSRRCLINDTTYLIDKKIHGSSIKVKGLSPSPASIDAYQNIFYEALPKREGELLDPSLDKYQNLVSSAFLFCINDLTFILGGDVENGKTPNTGWKGICSNFSSELASKVIKVPHHGSKNAFSQETWEHFSNKGKPISIITPYNKSCLPKKEILEKISEYSSVIVITSDIRFDKPKRVYDRSALKHMKQDYKSWKCIKPADEIGNVRINISIKDNGLEISALHPAFRYS